MMAQRRRRIMEYLYPAACSVKLELKWAQDRRPFRSPVICLIGNARRKNLLIADRVSDTRSAFRCLARASLVFKNPPTTLVENPVRVLAGILTVLINLLVTTGCELCHHDYLHHDLLRHLCTFTTLSSYASGKSCYCHYRRAWPETA